MLKPLVTSKIKAFINPLIIVVLGCFSHALHAQVFSDDCITKLHKGNIFCVTPSRIDTVMVQDPATGKMEPIATTVPSRPLKMNGQKIYRSSDVDVLPSFKDTSKIFGNYLLDPILIYLDKLPEGIYNLMIYNVVISAKGDLVYYNFPGLVNENGDYLPSDKNSISDKIRYLLDTFPEMNPAKKNGEPVPYVSSEPCGIDSRIIVKDHKASYQ